MSSVLTSSQASERPSAIATSGCPASAADTCSIAAATASSFSLTSANSNASLCGKYWYIVPTDTPARSATRVVVRRATPSASKT
jgi:hypothetical protein